MVDYLAVAIRTFSGEEQEAFFRRHCARPASRRQPTASEDNSRQARHARLRRLVNLATAGSALLALRDARFRRFTLSADYGRLHPYSMEVYSRFLFLVATVEAPEPGSMERMCRAAADQLLALFGTGRGLGDEHVLEVQASIAWLFGGVVTCGEGLRDLWRECWRMASRRRLVEHPFLRMQLGLMGSFVGCPEPHLEWLLDPRSLALEMGDAYCFVRQDFSPSLYEALGRCARAEVVSASECLYPPRPISTLNHLVEYCRTCLRNPEHFHGPGLVLMLLLWIAEINRELERLVRKRAPEDEVSALNRSLAQLERIQVMEKNKFWSIVDSMPDGPARARVCELWARQPWAEPPRSGSTTSGRVGSQETLAKT